MALCFGGFLFLSLIFDSDYYLLKAFFIVLAGAGAYSLLRDVDFSSIHWTYIVGGMACYVILGMAWLPIRWFNYVKKEYASKVRRYLAHNANLFDITDAMIKTHNALEYVPLNKENDVHEQHWTDRKNYASDTEYKIDNFVIRTMSDINVSSFASQFVGQSITGVIQKNTPVAKERLSTLTWWFVFWPLSLINFLIHDLVIEFVDYLTTKVFNKMFKRISDYVVNTYIFNKE